MEDFLSGCPSCCRHVRASETSCPFCHAAIGLNARRAGRVRIGLAAACAIGLGPVTIAACSSSSPGVSVVYGPHVIPECADAGVPADVPGCCFKRWIADSDPSMPRRIARQARTARFDARRVRRGRGQRRYHRIVMFAIIESFMARAYS